MATSSKKELLKELETLADSVSVKVRYEKTDARGGLCTVKGKQYIIINRKSTDDYKISVIIDNLRKLDLKDIYINPKLRNILDTY